jgi:ABC-type iron transport system FetAB permease component
MSIQPFWTPERYSKCIISFTHSYIHAYVYVYVFLSLLTHPCVVPVVGMLCGSTISGIVLSLNYVLKELHDNRDKIETYLAFGASRFEACRPIARDALRTALTPNVNQMRYVIHLPSFKAWYMVEHALP